MLVLVEFMKIVNDLFAGKPLKLFSSKGVPENFTKFTGKTHKINKVAGLLWHRGFQ